MPALNASGRVVKIDDFVSESALSAEARSLLWETIKAYVARTDGPEVSDGLFDKLTNEVVGVSHSGTTLLIAEKITQKTRRLCLVPT